MEIETGRDAFLNDFDNYVKKLESILNSDAKDQDIKRENANIDGDTAMGTMLHVGSNTTREYCLDYLMTSEMKKAYLEGEVHYHDMDFWPMGTTTCTQIDLDRLFTNGFSTGHGYLREPQDIRAYAALAAIAIQSNQSDQHGGQSIPYFDRYMKKGVLKTFRKNFKKQLNNYLIYTDKETIEFNKNSIQSIKFTQDFLESLSKELNISIDDLDKIYGLAYADTEKQTFQAMEAFVHNLNTMNSRAGAQVPFSSINFGMDITPEGRMVSEQYLLAHNAGLGNGETPIFPIAIFTVKEGVNYNPGDPNYDLYKLAIKVSAKRLFPNFCFVDAPQNLPYYEKDPINGIIATMGCRTRVLGNVCGEETTPGRGNLSFTTINLPRLGIKYGICTGEREIADFKGFYDELDNLLNLVKDQLLMRFEHQCKKHTYNFPFLLGQGVWKDSDFLNENSNLKEVLKYGSLSIGFIGLAETLVSLIGKHHGESKEAQNLGLDIIGHIRKKCDEYSKQYNLNFTCLATPAEGLSGRFTKIDKQLYGKIKGVTDKEYYTNSNHVPVEYPISIAEKIKIEGPYHYLTNAGHICYIELDGDPLNNLEAFEQILRKMKEAGVGYGAINHPVDRDPVCGYTGIINNICPRCGRQEGEWPTDEKIEELIKRGIKING